MIEPECPKCGSDKVALRYLAPYMAEGFALLGGFVGVEPHGTLVMKCERCGCKWAERATGAGK